MITCVMAMRRHRPRKQHSTWHTSGLHLTQRACRSSATADDYRPFEASHTQPHGHGPRVLQSRRKKPQQLAVQPTSASLRRMTQATACGCDYSASSPVSGDGVQRACSAVSRGVGAFATRWVGGRSMQHIAAICVDRSGHDIAGYARVAHLNWRLEGVAAHHSGNMQR